MSKKARNTKARSSVLGMSLSLLAVGACSGLLDIEPPGPPPDGTGGAGGGVGGGTGGVGGVGGVGGGTGCMPDTYACNGLSLEKCNPTSGQYETLEVCTEPPGTCRSPVCNAALGACGSAIEPAGTACTNGHCDAGGNCILDVCAMSEKGCEGDVPKVCLPNGQWDYLTPCAMPTPTCVDGECKECAPNAVDCVGDVARACVGGQWQSTPCGGLEPHCVAGVCKPTTSMSCQGLAECLPGMSCCSTSLVMAGSFEMGRSTVAGDSDYYVFGQADEDPEHVVNVSTFYLDDFDVTVGRFRWFVDNYDAFPPLAEGDGAHPNIPGSGWKAAYDAFLPADAAALRTALLGAGSSYATWTDAPVSADAERRPVNFVNWYVAFAFCIRDGGRLPTEVEWERAATGLDNRLYPWGPQVPEIGGYAAYNCIHDGVPSCTSGVGEIAPVGYYVPGRGHFGQYDLGGNMFQWTRDSYAAGEYDVSPHYPSGTCSNCANLNDSITDRSIRGGGFSSVGGSLRSAARDKRKANAAGLLGHDDVSFRCARP